MFQIKTKDKIDEIKIKKGEKLIVYHVFYDIGVGMDRIFFIIYSKQNKKFYTISSDMCEVVDA
jgi:hypothetical protein